MAEVMIEVNNLTKFYGDHLAVDDISFEVKKGEVVGFLGPNGSGKTTTMRILTGYLPPSTGTANIAGFNTMTDSLDARRHIGYLPETVPLYTDMTVKDYLRFMGKIRGMGSKDIDRRIADVIDTCHLEAYYTSHIAKLSKGFRQRVGIAQAILHEPEVLVLDEPTVGIDPIQVVETRELIKGLGGDRTIILSTHILPEVSMICERVIIIHEGEIVAVDHPEVLAERLEGTEHIRMGVIGPRNEVIRALREVQGVQEVTSTEEDGWGSYSVFSRRGDQIRVELAKVVVEHGWGLLSLETLNLSLEEIFLRLTTSEEA